MEQSSVPQVYQAISDVQAALAEIGIAKNGQNSQQGYKFRGIDAVYNAIAPLLPKHGLIIVPRVVGRWCEERQSKQGGALFNVIVDVEFDFISVKDGSKLDPPCRISGEAMDSADKATNKAMSAAHKYAVFMTFTVPTEGDNDADQSTHEVQARSQQQPQAQRQQPASNGNGNGQRNGGAGLLVSAGGKRMKLVAGTEKTVQSGRSQGRVFYTFTATDHASGRTERVIVWDGDGLKKIAQADRPEQRQMIELVCDVEVKEEPDGNGGNKRFVTLLNLHPLSESAEPDDPELGEPMDMAGAPGYQNN